MTVLRSEARAVLQWCLNQPGWWRTRDVAFDLGLSLDAALKQMRRLDQLNIIQRGELNGRTALWRIRDLDHAETVAFEEPKPPGYWSKKKPAVNSIWTLPNDPT